MEIPGESLTGGSKDAEYTQAQERDTDGPTGGCNMSTDTGRTPSSGGSSMASGVALGDVRWPYAFLKRQPRWRVVCGGVSSDSCLGSPSGKVAVWTPARCARAVGDGRYEERWVVPTAFPRHTYSLVWKTESTGGRGSGKHSRQRFRETLETAVQVDPGPRVRVASYIPTARCIPTWETQGCIPYVP